MSIANLVPITEGPRRLWAYMIADTLANAKVDLETDLQVNWSYQAEVGDLVIIGGSDGASIGRVTAVVEGTSVTMTHSDLVFA